MLSLTTNFRTTAFSSAIKLLELLICFIVGLSIPFLSLMTNVSVFSFVLIWPLFCILLKCNNFWNFYISLWCFFSGFFFFLFLGLIQYYQNYIDLSFIEASLFHFLISFALQTLLVGFVTISFFVSKILFLNRHSLLFLTCFFIYLSRLWVPTLFPQEITILIGGGESFLKQLLSIFGTIGLEFVLLLINLIFAILYFDISSKAIIKKMICLGLIVVTFSILFVLSQYEKTHWVKTDSSVQFAFYQPGSVPKTDIADNLRFEQELKQIEFVDLLLKRNLEVDFFIFPETYFFSNININKGNVLFLKKIIQSNGVPIFSGGHSLIPSENGNFNTLFYLDRDGNLSHQYYKRMLMPVGETKFFRNSFPWLSQYMPGENLYYPGAIDDSNVLKLKNFNVGFAICYEDIWSNHYAEISKQEADFIISVSSDNQFKSNYFAENHLSAAVSKALEYRKPLLRVTNTGNSSITDASGKFLKRVEFSKQELNVVNLNFKKNSHQSFYSKYSEFQIIIIFLITLVAIYISEKLLI